LEQARPSAEDFALVAQDMQDIMGEEPFEEYIRQQCKLSDDTMLTTEMVHRIRCLSRIPFKAIITTNYNSCFRGLEKDIEPALLHGFINPCSLWESILRGTAGHDQERNLLDDQEEVLCGAQADLGDQDHEENCVESYGEVERMTLKEALDKYKFRCPILKIHGCVEYPNSIVLSRKGYKRLQYETPGFKMFLTSAMATNTMLYIGFSFTDDYLNEFRAEVLKMLRPSSRTPVQYNVVLSALKHIGKPEILSHFYDANFHDDYLTEIRTQSTHSDQVRLRLSKIQGIEQADITSIEMMLKERAVVTSRRPAELLDLDKAPPIAYAIIDNKSEQQIDYFRRHEGVQIMTWKTGSWFGGLDAYLDGILRETSRPFLWGSLLTKSVLDNGRVIVTWDIESVVSVEKKKSVAWWLMQCVEFYNKSARHWKSLREELSRRVSETQGEDSVSTPFPLQLYGFSFYDFALAVI
jgi:hypothetical protein